MPPFATSSKTQTDPPDSSFGVGHLLAPASQSNNIWHHAITITITLPALPAYTPWAPPLLEMSQGGHAAHTTPSLMATPSLDVAQGQQTDRSSISVISAVVGACVALSCFLILMAVACVLHRWKRTRCRALMRGRDCKEREYHDYGDIRMSTHAHTYTV